MNMATSSSTLLGDCFTACFSIRSGLGSAVIKSTVRTRLTSSLLYGLSVVFGNVIVDPGQVPIWLLGRIRNLHLVQPLRDHAVAEQTGQKSNLKSKPVFRLANV